MISELSVRYLVGKSSVLGTGSFYDFLKPENIKKKVLLCDGTACLTSGKQDKLKNALLKRFSEDEIGSVTCLGQCHSNNAFLYDNTTWAISDFDDAESVSRVDSKGDKIVRVGTNADAPVLVEEIGDLSEYYRILKEYSADLPGALREIELSGLRGRGGAGFLFHVKLGASMCADSDQKFVVCNADEGDPGAFSDKWLIEERAHSVLFGMMMTGLITGAGSGVIYIRGEYPESLKAIRKAIEQLEKQKLTLKDLTGKEFAFHIVAGAGAYICGEETSLLNSIEGLRPEVRTRPPYPASYGLFGKPTVLSNVETFANIRFILKGGGERYFAMGTSGSSGTKLVSLDGAFRNPGIYEVMMGTPLNIVLNDMGGGTRYPVKAFQIGGPLGGIVPASMINDLTLDFESFSHAGFMLGHAGIVSIPVDFPMMTFLMHLFDFTSKESCGKCFPCRIGSVRGYELLKGAVEHGIKIDNELFSDLLETMQLGSLCALGGGISLPAWNVLRYFSSELENYVTLLKQE